MVDGFVLPNDQNAKAFASGFPQVIKALYLTDEQRERVARVVEPMIPSLETLVSSYPELKDPAELIASMDVDKGLFEEFEQSPKAREEDLNRTLDGEVLTLHIPVWLSRSGNHIPRTLFYALLAKAFRIPYAPHPVRCPLLEVFAEKQLDAARDTILHFKGLVEKVGENLASAFNGYDLRLDIPPVAQYVIQTPKRQAMSIKIKSTEGRPYGDRRGAPPRLPAAGVGEPLCGLPHWAPQSGLNPFLWC